MVSLTEGREAVAADRSYEAENEEPVVTTV